MNFVKVLLHYSRVPLLGYPLVQERCPYPCRADSVHADAIFRVVERHRFLKLMQNVVDYTDPLSGMLLERQVAVRDYLDQIGLL